MASELRVAVVEDDAWKRSAIADQLDRHERVDVVYAVDQDEAASWSRTQTANVDVALVDIYDDTAPGEVGTDVYSGIAAVRSLRKRDIRVIAISPMCAHPLVQLRLAQAEPGWVYHRWEVRDVNQLVEAIFDPRLDHRVREPSREQLDQFGARHLRANDTVDTYLSSPLSGMLQPRVGLKHLPVSRSVVDRFCGAITDLGLSAPIGDHAPARRSLAPRWPEVRDVLLCLLGRLEAPPSEHDSPWWA